MAQNKLAVSTPAYLVCIRLCCGVFAMHCLPWQWRTANVCLDRRWACQRHHRGWATIYRVLHRRIGVEGERISKASVTARKIAWCINQRLSRCAISYEPSTVPIAASPVTWASHVLQGNTLSLPIGFYWKTSLELRGAAAAPTRGCPCLMNVMGPPWCRSVIGDYLGKGQDSTT